MRRNLVGAAMGVVAAGAVLTACGGGGSGSATAANSTAAGSTAAGSTAAGSTAADSTAAGSTAANSTAAGSTVAAAPSSDSGSAAQTVEVTATEYKFGLPTTHLAPGTYTFVMKDDGHATHAMAIDGPGVDNKASGTSGPGGTARLTVTLKNGTYVLYCPVGNHRALGMQTDLTVE